MTGKHHWPPPLASTINTTGQQHWPPQLVSTTGRHHWPGPLTTCSKHVDDDGDDDDDDDADADDYDDDDDDDANDDGDGWPAPLASTINTTGKQQWPPPLVSTTSRHHWPGPPATCSKHVDDDDNADEHDGVTHNPIFCTSAAGQRCWPVLLASGVNSAGQWC